ncbi:Uncharacterised protein [Vibrio cholerae]|nr:Uncharacterised protein [Vibrio cholerae]
MLAVVKLKVRQTADSLRCHPANGQAHQATS